MSNSIDDTIKETVLKFISEGKTLEAIQYLEEFKNNFPDLKKFLPIVSSQYKNIQKKNNLQVITNENYQLEINRINLALVSYLEDGSLINLENIQNQETKENKNGRIIRLGIVLSGSTLLILFLFCLFYSQSNNSEEPPQEALGTISISIVTEVNYKNDSFDKYKIHLKNLFDKINSAIRINSDTLQFLQDSLMFFPNILQDSKSKEVEQFIIRDFSPIHPNIFCDSIVKFAIQYNDVYFDFNKNPIGIDSFVILRSTLDEISSRKVMPDSTTLKEAEKIYDRIKPDLCFSFTTGLDPRGLSGKHEIEYNVEENNFYLNAFDIDINPKYYYTNSGYINTIDDLLGSQLIVSFPSIMVSSTSKSTQLDAVLPSYKANNRLKIIFLRFSNGQQIVIRGEKTNSIVINNIPYYFFRFPDTYKKLTNMY